MDSNQTDPPSTKIEHIVFPKNDSKWERWLSIFLSFVFGAFSAAFFAGGKSRDVGDLMAWRGDSDKQFVKLWDRINEMDRGGTSRSHWVDENQSVQITANQARISELERRQELRGEAMAVMQQKLDRLEGGIRHSP